ncbi:MAG TPA: tetratricopeptide repeat protein [Planktothrix sp.]|jgi:tetratricopeptide (TPR) repeat protein
MPASVSMFLCESMFEDRCVSQQEALSLSRKLATQATYYQNREQVVEAEMLFELAILIAERADEVDQSHIATCSHHLADIYSARSDFQQALPLYARSIAIWESSFGRDHKVVGLALHSYGEVLSHVGRQSEADNVLVRARKILGDLAGISASQMAEGMTITVHET